MVDVVISIAAKVAELLVVPIGKHMCYPFKYKSNITELKRQVEKLKNEKEKVQDRIDEASRQGNEIKRSVEEWMNRVDEFTERVVKPLIDGEDNANKRCFVGLCNNLMITRYLLSKKAVKMTKDGISLLEDGKFDVVGHRPALERIASIYIEDYLDFDSRKPLLNDLMEALKSPDAKLIGVYGMGGVGKTTLVKRAADQAVKDKLFDVMVVVELKQIPEIKDIQGRIADGLGITLNEETLEGRAARLRRMLKKEKRVLIVLDNIWSKLDLHAVGIPINEEERGSNLQEEDPEGRNDDRRQCKVLLTSRREEVLSNHMNTTKNILVRVLDDQEAKDLFWKTVGDSAKIFDFEPIGVEIVKYCDGLPIAIATVASALKNKSPFVWKDALDQLRRANPRHIKEMEKNVYSVIKLSYDFLESEEEKPLFLLCSLHDAGEHINIEYLLRYGMGLCLFKNVFTLEEGRNRLSMLISKLKASSLLLDGNSNKEVKMHDVIHAVGVSIASTEKLMFNIPDDTDVKEILEKLPKDSIAVSLRFKNVSVLPERLEFRKLKTFFLLMDQLSLEISDVFFEGMKKIEVLDLTRIRMSSLPPSLCGLTNLQTLCLDYCELGNIAIIGELKTLEILCFLGSDIEQLPKEIGQLTRLRLLDLTGCTKLQVISPNVIPSLTRLEELYMGNGFIEWESEGQSNVKLSDLKHLSLLTTLEIHVLDARIMPQDLLFEKLRRYKIFIGGVWEWSDDHGSSRMMKLKLNNPIYLGEGVKGLLNTTEDLYLDELNGVKNILYQLNGEGFPRLKNLHVQNGLEMHYVINSIEWGLGNVFPRLESLFLHSLINLEKICHGQLSEGSFSMLRILQVRKCDRLKYLFSFSVASNLLQLQEIEVANCRKLEEIILKESEELVHQNDNNRRIQFAQLHTLTLQCLPQLASFVLNAFTPDVGSQEILAEDEGCMPYFSQNVVLPSLKNLKLFSINIRCKWLDELPVMTSCCQALTNLTLEECNGLRFLFSYSMVNSLVQLQKLEMRNCQLIEEIINTEARRGQEKMNEMVFPKLISLHLKGLPKLTRFSSGNLVEFPSLTELSIEECPKLKTFFSASTSSNIKQNEEVEETNCQDDILPLFEEKVILPTLASLNLSSICIQTIWHNQLQAMSSLYFQNLTKIIIDGCDTLKYAFSSFMVSSLIQLEVVQIINCKLMENVIITGGERISSTMFPKLYQLDLKHLPELTSFCTVAGTVGLPSLTMLWLQNCPKMLTFVSEFPHIDKPENKEEQMNSEENQHSQVPALFNEKVRIPELKDLWIGTVHSVRKLWHHQLALDSFSKMSSFHLYGCHNLLSVFPSNMLGRLQNLGQMWVAKCDSLETIFEISFCVVEEIVANEDDAVAVPTRIVFPQLTWLHLTDLPSLRSFYQGSYISEWPKLKKLRMWSCNKVEILTSDFWSLQETHRENQLQNSIQGPLFVVDKVVFPKVEELALEWNWIVKDIQRGKFSEYSCNLKILELLIANNQSVICPCCFLYSLPHLENLRLYYPSFREIFTCEGLDCKETRVEPPTKLSQLTLIGLTDSLHLLEENSLLCKVFQHLKYLEVSNCVNLKNLVPSFVSFQNLTTLGVLGCNGLVNLMEGTVAKSLGQLRRLKISYCKMIEEIISYGGDEVEDRIIFDQLRYLELHSLPKLTSFCSGNYILEFQSLQQVVVRQCPNMKMFSLGVISTPRLHKLQITEAKEEEFWEGDLNTTVQKMFEEMVGFKSMENFTVSEFPHLKEVWHKQVLVSYFNNLKSLVVDDNCSGLRYICTPSMAMDLAQLQELEVKNCAILEAIVVVEEGMMRYTLFRSLNKLKLEGLPELASFCNTIGNSIELPSLASLLIENCPNMQTFISNSTKAGMPESKDNTFTDVQPLFDDKVILPALASLNLSSICIQTIWHNQLQAMSSSYFQNLTKIIIDGCDTLRYAFSSFMVSSLIQLEVIQIINCKLMENVIITRGERISNTMFPKLYQLDLKHLPELTSFCTVAGTVGLPSLTKLWLENCPKMLTFISEFPHTDKPENKEEQTNSEENQHSRMPALFDEKVQIPELKHLRIDKVDNVRKIWHHHLALDSFSKMSSFISCGCHNLLSIFPSNMLGRLQNLGQMWVGKCDSLETIFEISSCMVEEIVADEDDVVAVPARIVFPQLTWLELTELPSLRSFYQGSFISEWPKLKKLRMWSCNKVEILTSDFLSLQETHRENQLQNSIQRPLFVVDKVVFPKVEELALEWNWIVKDIQRGKFSEYSCNLKVLELAIANNQSVICPCCFLYSLPHLENLQLCYPSFREIFTCEGLDCKETRVEPPTKLSQLTLVGLTDSLHLLEENSLLCKVFQHLKYLEVSNCVNLRNLVPSFVSFQNLTTLEVLKCDGLVNLMEGTVAKSLGQLRRLKISYCKMIKEIISYGGDEVEDRIIFDQLRYLELHSLPKLTSFCFGNYIFEFQSLQQVVVRQCPNMKMFSLGVVSTPRLHKLQITEAEDEEFWEGGLNTTIRKMFEQMVGFNGIENFTVSEFPHLKEIWHKQVLVSYFKNLKSLVVDNNCSGLRYICTPSMAMDLAQLQELEVKNCAILEAIVAVEEGMMRYTLFPNLNRLELGDLPELTSFCNNVGNSIELPSLVDLWIENCPNMQTFISNSTNACMPESKDDAFTDVQPLFDDKVQLSSLRFLTLVKMDKLRKIWHHQLTSNSFCKLSRLWVQNCHNVLDIFSSNMLERLQKLGELWLINCSSLDGVFELQASSCGKSQTITATQLKRLVLRGLPKLNHVWKMDSHGALSFQSLLSIEVIGCNSLKSLIPASAARTLLQLEVLKIEECCMLEEIVAKEEEVDESIPRFVFPKLTGLRLTRLSRLQHFYPMVHISEWPMLKQLQVSDCDKVEILASKLSSFLETQKKIQHEMPNDRPLLSFDKVPFSNLESLALEWNRIVKESLHERLPILSCKLKILTLVDFHEETDICVSCFLHKLPNLEKLEVYRGFFKKILLYEGLGCAEQHIEAPSKLSHLWLSQLSDSLHLWEENSMSSKVFQNLAILEVYCCDNLKYLVPSAVSFQNLTTLEVAECNGLLNVVVLSTAKSLLQLTKLSISNCKMIQEIITHETNEMEDWIILKKLRYLKLECLQSLTSFYSGNYKIDCPSLQQVRVTQCSNMKTFSRGILSTPRLHRLQTTETESEGFWKGNLNTTIEYLFTENDQSCKME